MDSDTVFILGIAGGGVVALGLLYAGIILWERRK